MADDRAGPPHPAPDPRPAPEEHPGDEAVLIQRALECYRREDYETAVQICRDGIRLRAQGGLDSPALHGVLDSFLRQARERATPDPGDQVPVPRQLPPDLYAFAGRSRELSTLRSLASTAVSEPGSPVVISAINGIGGIGKTALAVRFAHELEPRFPDGQLYANFHGYERQQHLRPEQVLDRFLRDLGVADRALPTSFEEQIELYNRLLRGRRILILLDNVSSSAEVRPLLPDAPTCFVLITSRDALAGLLATNDAHVLTLEALGDEDALRLLTTASRRDPQEPADVAAARAIVELCANLPLAIWVAGAKLAARPSLSLPGLADLLRDEQRRLSRLTAGDVALEASFEASYIDVTPPAARLFRHLGLIAGPDFTIDAAAAVAGLGFAETQDLLDELLDAHLVEATSEAGRYRFHDLLRLFSRKKMDSPEETGEERKASLERLLNWYLAATDTAADFVMNCQRLQRFRPPLKMSRPLRTRDEALAWLEAERVCLGAAVRQSLAANHLKWAWSLADAQWGFCYLRKHWSDWIENQLAGLDAARQAGDGEVEAWMLTNLGVGYWDHHEPEKALSAFRDALALCQENDDALCEARATNGIGLSYREQGRYDEALKYAELALPIRRRAADSWGEAVTLDNIAFVSGRLRKFDQAIGRFNEALKIWRQIGDPWGEALSLNDLGCVYNETENYGAAESCFRKSLEIRQKVGDRWGEAESLNHLGLALLNTRGPDAARPCWEASLELFAQIQAPEVHQLRERLASLERHGSS